MATDGRLEILESRILDAPMKQVNGEMVRSLELEGRYFEVDVRAEVEDENGMIFLTGKAKLHAPKGEDTTHRELREIAVQRLRKGIK